LPQPPILGKEVLNIHSKIINKQWRKSGWYSAGTLVDPEGLMGAMGGVWGVPLQSTVNKII